MNVSTELGKRITALRFEDLPEKAIQSAKIAILDTVGVALAGSREDAPRIAERALSADVAAGPCLIFGTQRRTTCLSAALINGSAAHVLDFDDCSDTLGGHPSAPILPALLALAEEIDATGREVVLAYIAGFETETRIARSVNFHHYTKGWHPTSTLGIFGAAAACSRLLNLPEEVVATSLSLSVSMASGVKANFGTMTKSLHVGHCSRNGLFATMLAKQGFTANAQAFEHKQGFFNVFNGADTYDSDKIFKHWADPLDIVEPGVAIKQYPCCGSTHPAIDAMIEITRAHRIEPDDIAQIDAWTHARRLAHTNRPDPQSDLEAKFSLQYCVARALMHSSVVLENFEGNAFRDPDVRRIMQRIRVQPYTEAQFDADNHFGGEIKICLVNGQTYSAKVQNALGRTSSNPLPKDRLREKFQNCAGRVLSPECAEKVYASILTLEQLGSIRQLMTIIANGVTSAKTALPSLSSFEPAGV